MQVTALDALANESCCRNYCGRTADGWSPDTDCGHAVGAFAVRCSVTAKECMRTTPLFVERQTTTLVRLLANESTLSTCVPFSRNCGKRSEYDIPVPTLPSHRGEESRRYRGCGDCSAGCGGPSQRTSTKGDLWNWYQPFYFL